MEGRPKKFTDPDFMQDMINDYFAKCDLDREVIELKNGDIRLIKKPYTITGLCLHLELDRVTLLDYEQNPMFSNTIKQAKQRVENYIEEHSLRGDINATTAIFNLKNNFGWKDKSEVETTDTTQSNYEAWLKKNQEALKDITPQPKEIEER